MDRILYAIERFSRNTHSLTHTYATIRKIESYKCTIEISRHKNILTHTERERKAHTPKQGTIVSVRHIEAAIRMRIITHSSSSVVCFVTKHIHFFCSGLFFLFFFFFFFWVILDDCVSVLSRFQAAISIQNGLEQHNKMVNLINHGQYKNKQMTHSIADSIQ